MAVLLAKLRPTNLPYLLQLANCCVHICLNYNGFEAICFGSHALFPVHGPLVLLYPWLQCDLYSASLLTTMHPVYQADCAFRLYL